MTLKKNQRVYFDGAWRFVAGIDGNQCWLSLEKDGPMRQAFRLSDVLAAQQKTPPAPSLAQRPASLEEPTKIKTSDGRVVNVRPDFLAELEKELS